MTDKPQVERIATTPISVVSPIILYVVNREEAVVRFSTALAHLPIGREDSKFVGLVVATLSSQCPDLMLPVPSLRVGSSDLNVFVRHNPCRLASNTGLFNPNVRRKPNHV